MSRSGEVRYTSVFRVAEKAVYCLLCLPLLLLISCGPQRPASADQPVPVRLRAPNHVQEPVSVAASGAVEANVTAMTAFQVGGRVAKVYVEEGQQVRKGQVLAELDPADYRHAYDAALGQADAASAQDQKARNGLRPQELEQARIDFERAQDEYQRMKFLFDRKSLDANDFHKYEAAYQAARQRYDMARQGARSEDKSAASAQARAAVAQMQEVRKQLADCRLVAPIAGFVGMKRVNVGDTVAAGNPVFSVLDLDSVKVRVSVPEAEIGKVNTGAHATVSMPSLGGKAFDGKLEALGVAADAVSRTYTAKIAVANQAHLLRDGMVSEARIYGAARVDVLTVPGNAIVRDARGVTLVYVYYPAQQRVFARRVDIGGFIGNEVQIKSGLKAGDQVVIAGQQNVHEGSPIRLAGDAQ